MYGAIPYELFIALSSTLEILNVQKNRLVGTLPSSIGMLSQLTYLNVAYNNELTGNLFSSSTISWEKLTNLKSLLLNNNDFNGSIPSTTFSNTNSSNSLKRLHIHDNEFTGTLDFLDGISSSSTTKIVLEEINISNNMFVGTIPTSISQLTNLNMIMMGTNQLSGSIPSNIGFTLSNLDTFIVETNYITGTFPWDSFIYSTSESSLSILGCSDTYITGTLPTNTFGSLASTLTLLDFWKTKVTGALPVAIGELTNLQHLVLSENALTGTIPTTIGEMKNLTFLSLSQNDFIGTIPNTLGQLSKLTFLGLSSNDLSGTIPSTFNGLSSLEFLGLSVSGLTGVIPEETLGSIETLSM